MSSGVMSPDMRSQGPPCFGYSIAKNPHGEVQLHLERKMLELPEFEFGETHWDIPGQGSETWNVYKMDSESRMKPVYEVSEYQSDMKLNDVASWSEPYLVNKKHSMETRSSMELSEVNPEVCYDIGFAKPLREEMNGCHIRRFHGVSPPCGLKNPGSKISRIGNNDQHRYNLKCDSSGLTSNSTIIPQVLEQKTSVYPPSTTDHPKAINMNSTRNQEDHAPIEPDSEVLNYRCQSDSRKPEAVARNPKFSQKYSPHASQTRKKIENTNRKDMTNFPSVTKFFQVAPDIRSSENSPRQFSMARNDSPLDENSLNCFPQQLSEPGYVAPLYRYIPKFYTYSVPHYIRVPIEKVVESKVSYPVEVLIEQEYLIPEIRPKYVEVPVRIPADQPFYTGLLSNDVHNSAMLLDIATRQNALPSGCKNPHSPSVNFLWPVGVPMPPVRFKRNFPLLSEESSQRFKCCEKFFEL